MSVKLATMQEVELEFELELIEVNSTSCLRNSTEEFHLYKIRKTHFK